MTRPRRSLKKGNNIGVDPNNTKMQSEMAASISQE